LAALPGLYAQRAYFTKFFAAYGTANPGEVSLGSLTLDVGNTLTAVGSAQSYAAVGKLARALEAVNVTVGADAKKDNLPYFTNVTIQAVGRSSNQITFTLVATMSPGVISGN
jgi:hypothetical protein